MKEPLIKGKSYMLVANHKSMIDIMLMLSIAKYPVVFVGKKELEKIPILGKCLSLILSPLSHVPCLMSNVQCQKSHV